MQLMYNVEDIYLHFDYIH